jgi:glycosyltransferase involved in cell wall biosynthesis
LVFLHFPIHLNLSEILHIDVIIPAFNEQSAIGRVIRDIPKDLVREIIVCNNGSTDQTAKIASEAGAKVIDVPVRGYGNACLQGIAYIESKAVKPDIIVFIDGDYSDFPEELHLLIEPITANRAQLVIGSRSKGPRQAGSMTPQQVFGNWLATRLIRLFFGVKFTDLGPFRAITYGGLKCLNMLDRNYGWTVEMQVKAAKMQLPCEEVAVSYRVRIGESKVSGTIKGTFMAGYKILWTIFKYI